MNQTNTKCESKFLSRSSFLRWSPSLGLRLSGSGQNSVSGSNSLRKPSRRQRLTRFSNLIVVPLHAGTGHFATLLKTYPVNSRFFLGVGLIIGSFWIKDIFLLFDSSVGFPLSESVEAQLKAGIMPEGHWYYINWYWFLSQIDEPLQSFVQFLGAFFIAPPPKKYPPSYFLGLPIGYHFGTIIWLFFCTSPKEVNSNPPWTFALVGVALTLALIASYEYLVHRYYHDFLRSVAALKSLIVHLPANVPIQTKEQAFDMEMKNFQSKF